VVVVGPPRSVFTRHLIEAWSEIGLDVRLVGWPDHPAIPFANRLAAAVLRRTLFVERAIQRINRRRFARAMGSENAYRPMVFRSLAFAETFAPAIRAMNPLFVCGLEVFAHGATVAACKPFPRVLMPWGGDIYMYGQSTHLARFVVGGALRSADLVAPGSTRAAKYVSSAYGVPRTRMYEHGGFWELDRKRFAPASGEEREAIRGRYGVASGALLVLNARRVHPAWGGDVAVDAFLAYARENANAHFILIGGDWGDIAAAREKIAAAGLETRFTIFDREVPLATWSEAASVSDVYLSAMREHDLRPLAGVLEPASAGAAPVLTDQGEYRDMEALGFRAIFVRPEASEIVQALRSYAASPDLREETVRTNFSYLDRHENGAEQITGLLDRVRLIAERGNRA
jgi:glycosyltransferase involved in cell wall biosynthesis